MFFYATESFRNARGLSILDYVDLIGMTYGYYNNRRLGGVSLNVEFKEMFRTSPDLFEVERELIRDVDTLDQDSKEEVRLFKERVGKARVEVQREINRNSPNRIQNLPEFYVLLKEMEDHTSSFKLHAVEPNDPRLQKLRRMIGEEEFWEDPELPQAEGLPSLVGTKDRRSLADMDTRYATGLRYI